MKKILFSLGLISVLGLVGCNSPKDYEYYKNNPDLAKSKAIKCGDSTEQECLDAKKAFKEELDKKAKKAGTTSLWN